MIRYWVVAKGFLIFCPTKLEARGLVKSYNQLGNLEVDYFEEEVNNEDQFIPY